MALTKRTYTDGETIITAANLNAIQDEIISQASTKADKTSTVSTVAYNSTSRALTKTINGTSSNIVTFNNIIELSVVDVTS